MPGRIVYTPPKKGQGHVCQPPKPHFWRRWSYGTVWECICGIQYLFDTDSRTGHWVWRRLTVNEYYEK